ncbi:O-antigen ligase family protein [Candidatus Parcubacteria bacterium]|nr:O-antigen ligase family protein [Candidatus Parcubacteria bacterium]
MSQNTYLNILKYGCYAALIIVFFVFKNLLFPFITSKQISFNILMEVLFIIWVAFIIKYPAYRPKKHYVWFGLCAFFFIMILSGFTGVDFNLSFWGDVERMLGTFHILHFLIFYFIIITVMRTKTDWKIFFIISTVFAVFVSLNAANPNNAHHYATIGNTAYVSGYLLMNMFFALMLFFREPNKVLRWIYILPLLLMLPGFKIANTSGAWVGLGASIVAITFLYGVLAKNRKIKIATLAIFILTTSFFTYTFIINRDNIITQNSEFVRRLVEEINVNKNTFQTRLVSWRAAIKDFPNHPFLGTGHGNYAITFDRHFSPTFYDHARGETYFDRAHNNVIDIASTTGGLGFLTYLFVLGALVYYLIKGLRTKKIGVNEFVIISALMTAYFVQNLAVFDSFVTYMAFMMTLGYVYWLVEVESEEFERPGDESLNNKEIYALVGVGLVLLTILYQCNVKPLKMLIATIDGQRAWASGQVVKTFEEYERALGFNTVLDRDSRTSMNRLLANGLGPLSKVSVEEAQKILDFNIEQAEINVDYNPGDSLNQMLLAQLYNVAAIHNRQDTDKFFFYSDQAIAAINASIAATPGRTPVYFQKAQIQINRNDKEGAIATLKEAAGLNPNYEPAFCHLGKTLHYFEQTEEAFEYIDKCLTVRDGRGASELAPSGFAKTVANHYIKKEDWQKVIYIYEALTRRLEKNNTENWINLAKLYARVGRIDEARETAEKVIELDPGNAGYAQEFINSLGQ